MQVCPLNILPDREIAGCRLFASGMLICLICLGCDGGYLVKQGGYILRYHRKAVAIGALLADTATPDSLRRFLATVQQIKKFSVSELGLADDRNYTTYVRLDKEHLVDVVCASAADRFEPFQWRYPFFGGFPYKGFFENADALREAERLKRKGLDVDVRPAEGFSTLGLFIDPIYSFMLHASVYSLANLIIHEQVHASIFLKNQVEFNEEAASFIGGEGALLFLRRLYGDSSEQVRDALTKRSDFTIFLSDIRRLHDQLQVMYTNDSLNVESKLKRKQSIITAFQEEFGRSYSQRYATGRFRGFAGITVNNAYLNDMMTYFRDLSLMYALFDRNKRDLRKTIDLILQCKHERGDPKQRLRNMLGL
jgi:predicted aminopeptidase